MLNTFRSSEPGDVRDICHGYRRNADGGGFEMVPRPRRRHFLKCVVAKVKKIVALTAFKLVTTH